MAERKVAIIGFPKCGTMSLALWSKQKYQGCEITRPENIYNPTGDWSNHTCMVITRNPVDRIQSCIRYWPAITKIYHEKGIVEVLKGLPKYNDVGFGNPIEQSDYQKYIDKFEDKHHTKVEVYRFEDMIKSDLFPHINESENKLKLTDRDVSIIHARLQSLKIPFI